MVSSEQQNISYPKSKYLKSQIILSFYDEDTPFLSKWVHFSNVFQSTNLPILRVNVWHRNRMGTEKQAIQWTG